MSKNMSGRISQKLLDHAKQSPRDVCKTASKEAIQKTVDATGDLIGDKTAGRITKFQKITTE